MKKIFFIAAFCVLFLGAGNALAGNPFENSMGKLDTALKSTGMERNLGTSIGTIVQALLATVGTIFLILTIYAGILWMTAQGNEEKVGKAKQIVTAAVIGLVITVSAYAVTAFVTGRLGNSGGGSGNTGCCCDASGCISGASSQADCGTTSFVQPGTGSCPK